MEIETDPCLIAFLKWMDERGIKAERSEEPGMGLFKKRRVEAMFEGFICAWGLRAPVRESSTQAKWDAWNAKYQLDVADFKRSRILHSLRTLISNIGFYSDNPNIMRLAKTEGKMLEGLEAEARDYADNKIISDRRIKPSTHIEGDS